MRPAILDLVESKPGTTYAAIVEMVAKLAKDQGVECAENSIKNALDAMVKNKNLAVSEKDGQSSFKFLSRPKKKPGRKAKAKDKL